MKKIQYISPEIEEMVLESENFIALSAPTLENPVPGNGWNW